MRSNTKPFKNAFYWKKYGNWKIMKDQRRLKRNIIQTGFHEMTSAAAAEQLKFSVIIRIKIEENRCILATVSFVLADGTQETFQVHIDFFIISIINKHDTKCSNFTF